MMFKRIWVVALLLGTCLPVVASADNDLAVAAGLRTVEHAQNVAGGFDYLPDGDIIAADFVYGSPANLFRFDANHDGVPAVPSILYPLASDLIVSFVKVAPSGTFALFGVTTFSPTGLNAILKIDLLTGNVTPLVNINGNFDLAFLSETKILVSANDYTAYPSPNQLFYYDLHAGGAPLLVAEFSDVPSGPIALNSRGDLYYVRGTFVFPPPAGSHALLRFAKTQLDAAISGAGVLGVADATIVTLLDSGYDLALNTAKAERNEIFISDLGGRIMRFVEGDVVPTEFVSSITSGGSFSALAFFKPQQLFGPGVATRGKLGAGYAINYSDYYFAEVTAEDHDNDGRPDDVINGACSSDEEDCVNEKLRARACVGANGFLGQVNIASVINQSSADLSFTLEYFDQAGFRRQQLQNVRIPARLKSDFIVNDLGLQPDKIGTLCVTAKTLGGVDAPAGSWSGGMALYKPNGRSGAPVGWGESFDFALYYPFENARYGRNSAPLNTYRLGMDSRDVVANWISIADASIDGVGLQGTLSYFDQAGLPVISEPIVIPDGGRLDLPGHVGLTGGAVADAIGTAEFVPTRAAGRELPYYMTVTRYFYDCGGSFCNNFRSAFNIPTRPAAQSPVMGGIATTDGEISIVELSNVSDETLATSFGVFNIAGQSLGTVQAAIPQRGAQHYIMNRVGQQGFLAEGEVGSATVQAPTRGLGAARSMFYKLDSLGRLEYGYSAALRGSLRGAQSTQFNTFINHINTVEMFNASVVNRNVEVQFVDFQGTLIESRQLVLPGLGGVRFDALSLPANTLGTVRVLGNELDLAVRNYTFRKDDYVLPFAGATEVQF